MKTANIILFLIGMGATIQTLRLFATNRSSIRSTVVWLGIWMSIAIFGLFPQLLDYLRELTMMGNRMFFLFVVAITVLYAMSFAQTNRYEAMERRLARLTQELALLRYELTDGKDAPGKDPSDEPDDDS